MSNPAPMSPPGMAYKSSFSSAYNVLIFENNGLQIVSPFCNLSTIPGLISTSWPILNPPSIILPPAIPPYNVLIGVPGLLISNDLITIIFGLWFKSL